MNGQKERRERKKIISCGVIKEGIEKEKWLVKTGFNIAVRTGFKLFFIWEVAWHNG